MKTLLINRISVSGLDDAGAEPRSITDWTQVIQLAWSSGANNTLVFARLMSRARACLPYGSWGRLWKLGTLPFSKRKGEMLVAIGQELGGLDAQNSAQLPPAWNTLYYLARLGRTKVEQLIGQGRVRPNLSLREARDLLPESASKSQRKSSCAKVKARLERFAKFICAERGSWPEDQRKFVHIQLLALADEISGDKNTHGEVKRFLDSCGAVSLVQTPGTSRVSFSTL